MAKTTKNLILNLAIPLAVGAIAAFLSNGFWTDYKSFRLPPFAPPGWIFPIVWTILYLMMGYSAYLITTADAPGITKFHVLCLYYVQLAVNFLWPLFFFRWRFILSAFFVLVLLWLLVFVTIWLFSAISRRACRILLPYLLWITFAGYLNYGIFKLN